jgi:hypothetical protein
LGAKTSIVPESFHYSAAFTLDCVNNNKVEENEDKLEPKVQYFHSKDLI